MGLGRDLIFVSSVDPPYNGRGLLMSCKQRLLSAKRATIWVIFSTTYGPCVKNPRVFVVSGHYWHRVSSVGNWASFKHVYIIAVGFSFFFTDWCSFWRVALESKDSVMKSSSQKCFKHRRTCFGRVWWNSLGILSTQAAKLWKETYEDLNNEFTRDLDPLMYSVTEHLSRKSPLKHVHKIGGSLFLRRKVKKDVCRSSR